MAYFCWKSEQLCLIVLANLAIVKSLEGNGLLEQLGSFICQGIDLQLHKKFPKITDDEIGDTKRTHAGSHSLLKESDSHIVLLRISAATQ